MGIKMKQWNSNAYLLVICLFISCAHHAYQRTTRSRNEIEDMTNSYSDSEQYLNQWNSGNQYRDSRRENSDEVSFIEKAKKKAAAKGKGKKGKAKEKRGTQVHMLPNKGLFRNTKGVETYTKCNKKTGIV